MKIETKYFGEQTIDENEIISFPQGIPGFLEEKAFILQPFGEAFFVLQSIQHANIAFVLTSPFFYYRDYEIDLPNPLVEQLEIKDAKDAGVFVIVHIHDPFKDSTVNLKAPIIINQREQLGKQYIINDTKYSTKQRLEPLKAGGVK
ncbi:flagellar assembly protein FliW [Terrilactibacillus sp. BCM23-1]|uniref:Flagellar assembly factor FliW n=1 Tax=Terrilactibacillus tamarindi TaxID=2599694 RepID=A0A6N8CNA4_9BACI|nr:flagellar assembly protein FliW [Terrilactibacillus tamarindi]MTT31562.1 flagellar assembly protein FliW [Terrilactibacillus tamarindi]